MTEEHVKEQLSKAYAEAVAAHVGIVVSEPKFDYGIDGTFQDIQYDPVHKRYSPSGFTIDYQVKSTINVNIANDLVSYELEAKNYRDLIKNDVSTPRILLLYELPRDKSKWIDYLDDGIILRKKAWWCSLKGNTYKANKSSVTIKIPVTQVLTSSALRDLMDKVKGGKEL